MMNWRYIILRIAIPCITIACLLSIGCEKVSPNAVELSVEFTWDGITPCAHGNPEIHLGNLPKATKFLLVSMDDWGGTYDHGKQKIPYKGKPVIGLDTLDDIYEPCPGITQGKYKIIVKALDEKEMVIGMGSKTRFFPENE